MAKVSWIVRLRIKFRRALKFVLEDMWRITENEVSGTFKRFINLIKIISISVRRFQEDDLMSKASALTYSTVLAVVPALAVIFAIAKGFGFQNIIQSQLFDYLPAQKEALSHALGFVDAYLAEARNGGVFVGVGIVFLFWTVISLMGNVENVLNDIWQVKKDRSFYRKITDYTSMFIILPILMIASSGLSLFISSGINNNLYLNFISPVVRGLISFSPYFLTCLLFTGIYILFPNTKVKFWNAFIAGIICGSAFQLFQFLYISGQIWVSKYNAIYGSFAFLPLFLLWMQLSWLICIFGAVLSFSAQNINNYNFERDTKNISRRYKDFFSILVASVIVKRFEQGKKAFTLEEISNNYHIPIKLTAQVLQLLMNIGVISEAVTDDERVMAYQPAMDINLISAGLVLSRLDKLGSENFKINEEIEYKGQWETLLRSREQMYHTADEVLLKDLDVV
ncbi:YihY/virulence factor BrkB family protein [Coprobacter tertius]|uniref:YihY/virulence factor BrkB family protein n=1 Tax=Coprobacter tertius TaxID=2944915 RepID=A0ABT1MF72_9BACT|nr:YihY/virulence factor BrkB family protein [Coprobacter tertius]MCP9611280.1 YihY/virulence factor BrkB family protein [Coprobacter tertius]